MSVTAAEKWTAHIDAMFAQQARIHGEWPPQGDVYGESAQWYRHDPHRDLDLQLEAITSYLRPTDVLLDWGGGAGRVCLPMALRCREVITMDSSPGMGAVFEETAKEAGITNARFVLADWLEVEGIVGDVSIAVSVIGLVRDIVPFIDKLAAASRRRVMVFWLAPLPANNWYDALFPLIHGEEPVGWPDHRLLLPVLWEMGILPDVRVVPGFLDGRLPLPQTREEAVALVRGRLAPPRLGSEVQARARDVIEAHLDEYVVQTPEGFRGVYGERDPRDERHLLITWETGASNVQTGG